ncbi:MAG: glycosyltransferase [Verrucomicrobiota bacterium]
MFSHAEEIEFWVTRKHRFRKIAGVLYLLLSTVYLSWRWTVLNPDYPILSLLLLLCEIIAFLTGLSLIYGGWNHVRRTPVKANRSYSVDVFVPVYSEPTDMIEMTVIGAKSIRYPHKTFLLDDGNRPELKELAEKHGVHYIARGNNIGAKAGNLNHALKQTSGDLVAIFDADHIAKRNAIDQLVGFFNEADVGLAQAPQMFYNEDAFVFRDTMVGPSRWDEQCFFYNMAQPSREHYGAASGVGTGALFRREALLATGGFPEETLTEDFHGSLKLLKAGWRTVYLNEPVAWGVAAADVPEYYKTRHRWLYGNLQALVVENILFCKGLSLRQRLGYLTLGLQVLEGWQQLLFILIPVHCMIFYSIPVELSHVNVGMIILVPFIQCLLLTVYAAGYAPFSSSQIFAIGRMHVYLMAFLALSKRKMRWRVSLKNVLGKVQWNLLGLHIFIFVSCMAGVLFAVVRWFMRLDEPDLELISGIGYGDIALVAAMWVGINGLRSGKWIYDTIHLSRKTHHKYLFEVCLPVLDQSCNLVATTDRISSEEWVLDDVLVSSESNLAKSPYTVLLPGGSVSISSEVGSGPAGRVATIDLSTTDLMLLKKALYSVDWHRLVRLSSRAESARRQGLAGEWQGVVLNGADGVRRWAMLLKSTEDSSLGKLFVANELREGVDYKVQVLQNDVVKEYVCKINGEQEVRPEVPEDLMGNHFRVYEVDIILVEI